MLIGLITLGVQLMSVMVFVSMFPFKHLSLHVIFERFLDGNALDY